jgi:hypothetical protein
VEATMPGEFEALAGAIERVKRLEAELRRTAESRTREAIKGRLAEAQRDQKQAAATFKAAADARDPESAAIMRELR